MEIFKKNPCYSIGFDAMKLSPRIGVKERFSWIDVIVKIKV
jgi:hypothetical protein